MNLSDTEVFKLVRGVVFTTDEAATAWFKTPHALLGNRAPIELMATEDGLEKVRQLALRMIHGVPG